MELEKVIHSITDNISQYHQKQNDFSLQYPSNTNSVLTSIDKYTENLTEDHKIRIQHEILEQGPLTPLLTDDEITEILVLGRTDIWFEKHGRFYKWEDQFLTQQTYINFIHRLCDESQIQTSLTHPFANGVWQGFRVHLTAPPVTPDYTLTLRKQRSQTISLERLYLKNWCTQKEKEQLQELVKTRQNLIIVGNTGSGKTTLMNAFLQEASEHRWVSIEDTRELILPNQISTNLLTRSDAQNLLPEINQTELVKQCLRMRPDRIAVGEVRGHEAKDLLMALSTGHKGSMTSLHAESAEQALLRLEMLIQMGAPEWSLEAIRRLIFFCVDYLVVTRKDGAKWNLAGIYKITSQEHFGFTVEKV